MKSESDLTEMLQQRPGEISPVATSQAVEPNVRQTARPYPNYLDREGMMLCLPRHKRS